MLVKIEDENSFQKNIFNRSLINTDLVALNEFKSKKNLANKVNGLSEEINIMKSDIADIKNLLVQLVNSKHTDN